MTCAAVAVADPRFQALERALDAELLQIYPSLPIEILQLRTVDGVVPLGILALDDDAAVGCGALQHVRAGVLEIRRMFVRPDCRRRGVARALVRALVARARAQGATTVRLVTGDRQPAAVALYLEAGFSQVSGFDGEAPGPHALCFQTDVTGSTWR